MGIHNEDNSPWLLKGQRPVGWMCHVPLESIFSYTQSILALDIVYVLQFISVNQSTVSWLPSLVPHGSTIHHYDTFFAHARPVTRRSPGFQVSEHFAHTELVTGITSVTAPDFPAPPAPGQGGYGLMGRCIMCHRCAKNLQVTVPKARASSFGEE